MRTILLTVSSKTDLTEFKGIKFFAKGIGRLTVKLTRDSIIDWEAQFKADIDLDPVGKDILIGFDEFHSDSITGSLFTNDLTTIQFCQTPTDEFQPTENVGFSINSVAFTRNSIEAVSLGLKDIFLSAGLLSVGVVSFA